MTGAKIFREITNEGHVVIRDERCRFVFRRLRAGIVEIKVVGADTGQFGTTVIDEIALALFRERPLKIFVDASEGSITPVSVSTAWARFFELNRRSIERVTVLATTKAVAFTMSIVRHLSNTGDLMQIYSDRELYEARKAAVTSS